MEVLYSNQKSSDWVKLCITLYFKGKCFINTPIQVEINEYLSFILKSNEIIDMIKVQSGTKNGVFEVQLTFRVSTIEAKAGKGYIVAEMPIIEILSSYEDNMNKLRYTGIRLMPPFKELNWLTLTHPRHLIVKGALNLKSNYYKSARLRKDWERFTILIANPLILTCLLMVFFRVILSYFLHPSFVMRLYIDTYYF